MTVSRIDGAVGPARSLPLAKLTEYPNMNSELSRKIIVASGMAVVVGIIAVTFALRSHHPASVAQISQPPAALVQVPAARSSRPRRLSRPGAALLVPVDTPEQTSTFRHDARERNISEVFTKHTPERTSPLNGGKERRLGTTRQPPCRRQTTAIPARRGSASGLRRTQEPLDSSRKKYESDI